ncbi:MAG: hypothetical protein QNK36_01395 [Colwellia sp.]|nr:hypothetical protein [Colwellia sp.]
MNDNQQCSSNIELFFDDFLSCINGRRVDDTLSEEVDFSNADYRIDGANCLIELKTLVNNPSDDGSFIRKLSKLNKSAFEKSLNQDNKTEKIADDIFNHFLESIEDATYPRIKKIITKANKQIRETKINLELTSYFGIVWIVNESNILLDPEVLKNQVIKALGTTSLSSVQAVIISNVNLLVGIKDKELSHLYWIPIFRAEPDECVWQIVHVIGQAWETFIRKHFEVPIEYKSRSDINIENLYNIVRKI